MKLHYISYYKHFIVSSVWFISLKGRGPRVVVSTAAFHARVRGSVPGLGGLKETKMFLPHPRVKVSIVGSLRDREVACSASDQKKGAVCGKRLTFLRNSPYLKSNTTFYVARSNIYVFKDSYSCKTGMRGTVTCRPTVA